MVVIEYTLARQAGSYLGPHIGPVEPYVSWQIAIAIGVDFSTRASGYFPARLIRNPRISKWSSHMAETAASRTGSVSRKTNETSVSVSVNLDGTGKSTISTGVGFFDHMLDQLSRHSLSDMEIETKGDLHVDDHHAVEDTGIAIGQAIAKALGDRRGITRYASIDLAMDETMTKAAVDLSGRPFLVWNVSFSAPKIGTFDTELVREFFQALAQNAGITLHILNHYGANNHHIAETCFKAVARALRTATEIDPRQAGRVPSTKGTLV
jgi:imidazoleglycerol-phosphate dehydratase